MGPSGSGAWIGPGRTWPRRHRRGTGADPWPGWCPPARFGVVDDVAFEAIDLVLWQADDVDMIASRAKLLAPAIGADSGP